MAGCRSTLAMSKIKVKISETKYCSFYKTLSHRVYKGGQTIISYSCRYEDSEEEDRGDMLCDNMMSSYNISHDSISRHSQESLSRHSQDSLARISSMTNSISPPLHSHGSLSPGMFKRWKWNFWKWGNQYQYSSGSDFHLIMW